VFGIDVSVVIPTFHRERQVVEAIDSVLDQNSLSIEVLVLDDSREGTAFDAVQSVADSRLRYIKCTEPSEGRPALVRNRGAALARGRYLHFLDDDDVLENDALAALAACLDATPDAGMAFGAIIPFGDDEKILRDQQSYFCEAARVARGLRGRMELAANLLFHPTILINSACMGRREQFIASGGYDGEMAVCEDVDLWARIARASNFAYVDRPIVRYRTGASSLMHDLSENDEKLTSAYRRSHRKYRDLHGFGEFNLLKFWARTTLRRF
jgi:glycosyltransferase involved in cell wall biosynthesis